VRYCFSDTETYCETPIKNGTFAYAEKVEVLLWSYAFDDGEVGLWDITSDAPMPRDLEEALADEDTLFVFHNSVFDVTALREGLGIDIPIERVRCSMARAYAHGLPGGLDALCTVLGLKTEHKKSKEGYNLIRLFCVPPGKNVTRGRATQKTHPKEWLTFCEYSKQDIVAMREVWRKLPEWNYKGDELKLWMLDARINRRGICIDNFIDSAITAVDRAQTLLKERTSDITFDDVESTTQRDALLAHILAVYDVALPDMQAATLERRIEDPDLPAPLKELLAIRLQATTSSTAKYKKIKSWLSSDGRLRGTLQFAGAARTARWAGRGPQYHNLARPTVSPEEVDFGIEALKANCADVFYENVMEVASNALRGTIVPSQGKKLVVSDLSNIEGRDQAWLAREEWKLKAFRDFDAGEGYDIYVMAYARAFHVSPESVIENKKNGGNWRQIGKVLELAMGYHGGVGSFVTFATIYNVDLNELAEKAWDFIPKDVLKEAKQYWDFCAPHIDERTKRMTKDQTLGLSEKVFITCDSLKRLWRRAHPRIVQTWDDVENAVRNAICKQGETFHCGHLKTRRDGNWLRVVLPSGRALCYPQPQVISKVEGEIKHSGVISYMGIDQYSRKWSRIHTYSGKLFENVCQAVARDVMAANMPRVEAAGYEIVLTIHDELVCEAPDTKEFNSEHLSSLLAFKPTWALDMPLAAGGYEAYRYRKE